jgi:VanZ family protein
VLVFAYSWAPFEASLRPVNVLDPLDSAGWTGLGLHALAFAAVGLLSRVGKHTVILDLSLCVFVEVGQLFMDGRHAEFHDLAVNAAGVLSGHALHHLILGLPWTTTIQTATRNRRFAISRLMVLLCAVFWVAALILPLRQVSLADWDLSYPLLVGNERDGDRAWEGEVRYLAVYDRSLSPIEVQDLSDSLPPDPTRASARPAMGAIALYDFTEAPVVLDAASPITSLSPGEPLSRRIAAQGSFSVEVWLKPADLTLTGPARIVGISESAYRRNFSLAQEGRSIYFRVRNPINGHNGINHEFRCDDALSSALLHVVITYDQGAISLYRDGRRHCQTLNLREPSLLLGLGGNVPSHGVTALLAALTFLLSGASLGALLLVGYGAFAVPLAVGAVLGVLPATSLYYWYGPLLIACAYATRVMDYSSSQRSPPV